MRMKILFRYFLGDICVTLDCNTIARMREKFKLRYVNSLVMLECRMQQMSLIVNGPVIFIEKLF
jgi:hypothetical protein